MLVFDTQTLKNFDLDSRSFRRDARWHSFPEDCERVQLRDVQLIKNDLESLKYVETEHRRLVEQFKEKVIGNRYAQAKEWESGSWESGPGWD